MIRKIHFFIKKFLSVKMTVEGYSMWPGIKPNDVIYAERFNILSKQPDTNILIVGHNPGIQDFSYWLSSEPTVNFPTCGVIHISFSLDNWTKIFKNSGKAMRFEYPKMFI